MTRVGSILHGAYGDYYEQLVCLKNYKRRHPDASLILFFAEACKLQEMRVFDLSFASEVYAADAIATTPIDTFRQYQVKDAELQEDILSRLPANVLAKLDQTRNLKPWHGLRDIDLRDAGNDVGLSALGQNRLPEIMAGNELSPGFFNNRFTIGFLWRYREPGGYVRTFGQTSEETLLRAKSELFQHLIREHGAHIVIAGMNVAVTEENRERISGKYTQQTLNLDPSHCTYLKGLSWGLEMEIMRRCSLRLMMPSGFTEALWMKRPETTFLLDAPPDYLLRLLYNRMPLFDLFAPAHLPNLWFQLRQPHSSTRVTKMLTRHGIRLPRTSNQQTRNAQDTQNPVPNA